VSIQQLNRPLPDAIVHLLGRVRRVVMPDNAPGRLVDDLRKRGVRVEFRGPVFYEKRVVKTPGEIAAIEKVQRSVEQATAEAIDIIQKSRVRGGTLVHRGRTLTADGLRSIMHESMIRQGSVAKHTIIACGDVGCDPHNVGHGPLRANQSIILDVFPRSESTLYFADQTRTVVKGKASPALRRQYDAVREAQEVAFRMIRPGADGKKIHEAVAASMEERGFKTGPRGGKMEGFFHGTGHGVGLDIHEAPSISTRGTPLPKNSVVTVEPGLYYFGVGGVRLEDMVLVTERGCRNLTKFPKILEV
jgi:Xaa-Pro aminopeptidase